MQKYQRVLEELGISSSADFQQRAELGKSILADVLEVAEEIVAAIRKSRTEEDFDLLVHEVIRLGEDTVEERI